MFRWQLPVAHQIGERKNHEAAAGEVDPLGTIADPQEVSKVLRQPSAQPLLSPRELVL